MYFASTAHTFPLGFVSQAVNKSYLRLSVVKHMSKHIPYRPEIMGLNLSRWLIEGWHLHDENYFGTHGEFQSIRGVTTNSRISTSRLYGLCSTISTTL